VPQSLAPVVWLAAAALVLFLALPLIALILRATESPRFTEATRHTLKQALELTLVTTGISMAAIVVFGTPLAYLLARRRFPGIHLVNTLIDLPMVLPPAVAGIALLMAFGRRGVVGRHLDDVGITLGFTTAAVVIAQIFVAVPFYVRAARAGFARVAQDLEDAAADLGAPPATVFRSVTLPLARPSLAAGAVLAWARAVGEFGATIMFAGNFPGTTQTMPLAIYGRYEAGDLNTALLLSAVLLAASMLVLLAVRLVGGRAGDLTGA
jgi:molybdate transport system permease protein